MGVFTVKDAYALMNSLVQQATGQIGIQVFDSSTFVSAGERVLETGMENVLNSLNIVLGRLIVSSRPYNAKLKVMNVEDDIFTNRVRKISFYSNAALPSGAFNTDYYTNLRNGFTAGQNEIDSTVNSTKSQWEQNQQVPIEMNFGNSATWQDCITMYEVQVQQAFRSETEFAQFIGGYLTEHANDIESQREAWDRMALVNKIASVYDMSANMPGSVVDLVAGFNTKFGTTYTGQELRTTHLKEFLAYMVAKIKLDSNRMTERSANYHWTPNNEGSLMLLRHTPKDKQQLYLYQPLFVDSEALVLPEIFNPQYLNIDNYEAVDFWQSNHVEAERSAISIIPAITDVTTGAQAAGAHVNLPYVVGMLTDKEGLMTNFRLEKVATTPLEARKLYRNTWNTFLKGSVSDNTENCIIYYMAS